MQSRASEATPGDGESHDKVFITHRTPEVLERPGPRVTDRSSPPLLNARDGPRGGGGQVSGQTRRSSPWRGGWTPDSDHCPRGPRCAKPPPVRDARRTDERGRRFGDARCVRTAAELQNEGRRGEEGASLYRQPLLREEAHAGEDVREGGHRCGRSTWHVPERSMGEE